MPNGSEQRAQGASAIVGNNAYVYVVFHSREDRGNALVALAKRGRVYSFRGGVYELSPEQRQLLDELGLSCREATPDEVEAARGSIHDPAAVVL
jgi:hypothetical protein